MSYGYGFGWDPEVPAGYQDADIEMAELAAWADEKAAEEAAALQEALLGEEGE